MATTHTEPNPTTEETRAPEEGWHCQHWYYRFDRSVLRDLPNAEREDGRDAFVAALGSEANEEVPTRLQVSLINGHKADFGVMMLDPDPLRLDAVHQKLMASPLGPALECTYSFVSMTEVSEYVPTVEQYRQRLLDEGETADSPALAAKVKAYEQREEMMRRQRLYPEFPAWSSVCFYPMNKMRQVSENWFLLPFDQRNRLMAEHGRTGMTFGGKVTQLITVGIGFEDWEWGVTLWARNPQFLKDIVYRMRFDEASARYAEFGPFYSGYVCDPQKVLEFCHV